MRKRLRPTAPRRVDALISRLRRQITGLTNEVAAQRRERETLRVVSQAVSQTLDLKRVLNEAFARMLAVAGLDAGLISLVDPATGVTRLVAWRGIPEPMLEELHARKPGEGLAAEVLRTGEPLVTPDLRREPLAYSRQAIAAGFRSYVCVPLRAQDRIVGICSVLGRDVGRFRERDVRLLCEVGEQIGVAIVHAQLYQKERRRAEQLRVINEVSRRIASILSVDELANFVTRQLVDTFSYDNANVFLLDPETETMVLRAGSGPFTGPVPIGARLKVGKEGIVGWVARSGQPLLVPDVAAEPRYIEMDSLHGIRSELAVPVRAGDTIVGVVDVESTRLAAFDEGDLFTVQILADQIAVALENARLLAESRAHAATEERNRLAGEIHDVLAQGLTAIALQIELAEVALESDTELARKSLRKALALTRGNLDEARSSVLDLRASALGDRPLAESIGDLARRFQHDTGIAAHVSVRGLLDRLPVRLERGLHRIAQEALCNVIQRLGAHSVDIELSRHGNELALVIRSDDPGFDPEDVNCRDPNRLCFVGLQERTKLLGGVIEVCSERGSGTLINVRVPISKNGRSAHCHAAGGS